MEAVGGVPHSTGDERPFYHGMPRADMPIWSRIIFGTGLQVIDNNRLKFSFSPHLWSMPQASSFKGRGLLTGCAVAHFYLDLSSNLGCTV